MRHALLASLVLALLAAVSRGASAPGPKPGQAADASPKDDGYVHLQRRWQAGDVVENRKNSVAVFSDVFS